MGDSGDESQGSKDEEPDLLPDDLDDEFFANLQKSILTMRDRYQKKGEDAEADLVLKVLQACRKYREDATTYFERVNELEFDIADKTEKLEAAIYDSNFDQETIEKLKTSTENAWREVDVAHAREQGVQEDYRKLKEKHDELSALVQKLTQKKRGIAEESTDITSSKEAILKERDKFAAEVKELHKRLLAQKQCTLDVEKQCAALEEKNKSLYKMLDSTSIEAFKEKKKADNIAKELEEAKEDRKAFESRAQALKEHNEMLIKNIIQQNLQILAAKSNLDQSNQKLNATANKLLKVSFDLEQTMQQKEKIQKELTQKANILKVKEDELLKLKQDYAGISKSNDLIVRKMVALQAAKNKVDHDIARLKTEFGAQEKEFLTIKKNIDGYHRKIDQLTKERDAIKRELATIRNEICDREEKINLAEQEIKSFKVDLKESKIKEKKLYEEINKAKKETERFSEQLQMLEDKMDLMQNDIQLKDGYIAELKKHLSEAQTKISQTQATLESTRQERNLLKKNLANVTKERNDLKDQLRDSNSYTDMIKENLSNKEAEVSKLEQQLDKLEKERTQLRIDLKNFQVVLQNTKSELIEKRQETDNLYKTLTEDENKLRKSQKTLQETLHEKTLLGSHLSKQNDEIIKLNERLEVLQAELDRGNIQYDQRLDDIRLLKIEIQNLRSEQEILRKDRENAANIKRELLRMHRLLNQERVKGRALQDEMLTPMNVHRWRTLCGKDPEKMELIAKVQNLQKRILAQNVTAIERENTLQQAHKIYLSLKEFMLKLPSYKVKQQLNEVRSALGVREKKLKALAAELNAKEVDDKAKDCVLESLRSNLEKTKQELTREKKKKQALLEERQIIAQMQLQCFSAPPHSIRTLGAGYKMPMN